MQINNKNEWIGTDIVVYIAVMNNKQQKINEITNWLKINPDVILLGQRNITKYNFKADALLELSKTKMVSIVKYTIDTNLILQIENEQLYK